MMEYTSPPINTVKNNVTKMMDLKVTYCLSRFQAGVNVTR